MIRSKKLSLILLIAVIAIISGCVKNPPRQPANPINNQPIATTTENNYNATTTEPVVVATSTNNWLTYKNEEYGYTLMYPRDWTVKDVNYYDKNLSTKIKYVAFTDDNYTLTFLLNKAGEDFSNGKTTFGTGDFEDAGEFKVEGINIKIKNLIYKNKVQEIFFLGGYKTYNISGHFLYLGDFYDANFNFDTDKFETAKKIIKSLKLFKPIVATTNTKDWLSYRNNEYGFELKFPSGWNLNENSWVRSGNEQNYVMVLNPDDYAYLIIDKIDKEKIMTNKDMDIKMLDNIAIGGYKTEIAYIDNGLAQDLYYRYFIRTNKENFQIYFVPKDNAETNKSIFYHIINTIKFDKL